MGIIGFLIDFISNLQFMIPIAIVFLCLGFFGSLRMRVATLIAFLIALWMAQWLDIVQSSIIGLLGIIVLFFWKKLGSMARDAIEGLHGRLKPRLQQAQEWTSDSPSMPKLPAKPEVNLPSIPKLPAKPNISMSALPKLSAKTQIKMPKMLKLSIKPKFAHKLQRGFKNKLRLR